MLQRKQIFSLFEKLNAGLAEAGEKGEIGVVGGAVMCLVYNARAATKDVDAIFHPSQLIRDIARKIAIDERLPPDWLNDGVKAFVQPGFAREEILSLSHLRVWAPEPRYMLAMKCISARWDSHDRDDVQHLITLLDIRDAQEVFRIIEGFYPKNNIPTKTRFFIEELLEIIDSDA